MKVPLFSFGLFGLFSKLTFFFPSSLFFLFFQTFPELEVKGNSEGAPRSGAFEIKDVNGKGFFSFLFVCFVSVSLCFVLFILYSFFFFCCCL